MAFNPAGTNWSVAPFDDSGTLGAFHPTPWEFHNEAMNAGTLWAGGYAPMPGVDNGYLCEITVSGTVSDSFEVYFLTGDRFIATKSGSLYRFGLKV
ncbi:MULTISPECIES: hypothetical protein [Kitasatospora]|uniref:hypothetical protein n=1 Tax=Kitasatospora TaxID=2063 RepID=UPI000CC0E9E4|nr:hypothetical protein [Kitasatospora sp. GP30]MDH6144361.1 hypothetical protein [Kitasatospora sp. GP30]